MLPNLSVQLELIRYSERRSITRRHHQKVECLLRSCRIVLTWSLKLLMQIMELVRGVWKLMDDVG